MDGWITSRSTSHGSRPSGRRAVWTGLAALGLVFAAILWQISRPSGSPDPIVQGATKSSVILDIGLLVFREGLECVLVLAAITAGLTGDQERYRRPVAAGAGIGFVATLITWSVAVRILADLAKKVSALALQASTGLLAIVVLLIVMNWFFHKLYWTGWISLHNRRKRSLLEETMEQSGRRNVLLGFALLGFSSFYREGVEVVLFLQSYRLKLGNEAVLYGVLVGSILSAAVAVLTFVAHRRLPYKRMLVLTGALLAVVLFVMVGEQAQEMQLAHWLPTTSIPGLVNRIPSWAGVWFSIFPTVETLAGQALALAVVLGSYFLAQRQPLSATRT